MALDSYRELLDELASLPPKLREAAGQAGEPAGGEWDSSAILAHMAATEQFSLERINLLLTDTQPYLRSLTSAVDERAAELAGNSWEENLDLFDQLRGQVISTLLGASPADWERSGHHDQRGTMTLGDVVEVLADHDAEHLAQMRELGNG